MPFAPERGITVQDISRRLKEVQKQKLQVDSNLRNQAALLGTAYDRGAGIAPVRDKAIVDGLTSKITTLTAFKKQGEKLEATLQQTVILPEIPDALLPDPKITQDPKLKAILIPDMSSLTPQEIRDIANGKDSPYLKILPRTYFQGIAAGNYPIPTEGAYIAYVDKAVKEKSPTTPLAEKLGLDELAHTPLAVVRNKLYKAGPEAIEKFGFDPRQASVKPLSTREAAFVALQEGNLETIITGTRVARSDVHLIFDGKDLTAQDSHGNGTPTRLAVVTRRLAPDKYISHRNKK